MRVISKVIAFAAIFTIPLLSFSQADTLKKAVTDTTKKAAVDSAAVVSDSSVAKKDTVVVAAAPKDCFQDWYEKMRQRGAKPVTDGKQPVIITLKSEEGAVCLLGQVEVSGGKIKPPLYVQQEDGEYTQFNAMGKKIDPAFASMISEAELLTITDGMSILFRTTSQEYGRLIFYTFANKAVKANKAAPKPEDLLQD